MRKALAVGLVLLALLGLGPAAWAQEAAQDGMVTMFGTIPVEDTIGLQRGTELVVGTTTGMSGYFATDMWGNNTADMDVRALLHGYSTVARTQAMGLSLNGLVVQNLQTTNEADGSRTYTVTIADNLVYNNGQRITAMDYVFSILLSGAREVGAIGGTTMGMEHLKGYEAYRRGETSTISGVRLLSEDTFSLSISGAYLPFFYGLAMLDITPYPMQVIAPGCEVKDDGSGIYIGKADGADAMQGDGYTPGTFSAEMLQKTLLDPQTGYVFSPKVTSGPYQLESFDAASGQAVLTANEAYIGNYEGMKPHIERLVFKQVLANEAVDAFVSGEVDLVNKITNGDDVTRIQALAADDATIRTANYLRTGYSFLSFACEQSPTDSAAVRRAIAMCLDKDAVAAQASAGMNRRVYGHYGLGQWMATYTGVEDDFSSATELEKLNVPTDAAAAAELLAADGWNLNASGDSFVAGQDTVRHRMNNGTLEPLVIKWAKSAESKVADDIESLLREPMAAIGIQLEVTEMPFTDVLKQYYRQTDRQYNMFFLATNFTYVFDPYYEFNTSDDYQGSANRTGLRDETLMNLAWDMRATSPSEMRTYVDKWLAFQTRFVELMPTVPLYCNVYFDVYTDQLQGYDIVANSSWADAVLYAYIGEAVGE